MSDTPRTDALVERFRAEKLFDVDDAIDLCRQLERELAALGADYEKLLKESTEELRAAEASVGSAAGTTEK